MYGRTRRNRQILGCFIAALIAASIGSHRLARAVDEMQKPVIPHERIAMLRAQLNELGFDTKLFDEVAQAVVENGSPELAMRLLLDGPEFTFASAVEQGQVSRLRLVHLAEKLGWGPLVAEPVAHLYTASHNKRPEAFMFLVQNWSAPDPKNTWKYEPDKTYPHRLEHYLYGAVYDRDLKMLELVLATSGDHPVLRKDMAGVLQLAIENKDRVMVERLLDAGASLSEVPEGHNFQPLQQAAWSGETSIAQLLLERGAKLDVCIAAGLGRLEDLKRLSQEPVPEHLRETFAATPLIWAARQGQLECARWLLDHGADVSAGGESGWNALHASVYGDNLAVVKLLLERGADPKALRYSNGHEPAQLPPIHYAAWNGKLELVQLFAERGVSPWLLGEAGLTISVGNDPFRFPDEKYEFRQLPLTVALEAKHPKVVDYLLRNLLEQLQKHGRDGMNPNELDTALLVAAAHGDFEVMRTLHKAGAKIKQNESITGQLPLEAASGAGHLEIVRYLLENGAAVDGAGADTSRTPLHAAAAAGHVEVARKLLDAGATIDARRPAVGKHDEGRIAYQHLNDVRIAGDRPLMVAVRNQRPPVVKLLLERGAKPNLETHGRISESGLKDFSFRYTTSDGMTIPLEVALTATAGTPPQPREALSAQYLIEAGARLDPQVEQAFLFAVAGSGNVRRLELLELSGLKVSADNVRSLVEAVKQDRRDMVRALLARGVSLVEKKGLQHERDERPPFETAGRAAHTLMLATIIEAAADRQLPIRYEADSPDLRYDHHRAQSVSTHQAIYRYYGGQPQARNNHWMNQAIITGEMAKAARFLEQGYDPNQPYEKRYPLLLALEQSCHEMVASMFRHGAKIVALPDSGHNVLFQAFHAYWKDPEIFKLLIERGADANVRDKSERTPVQLALLEHYPEIAQAMVSDRLQYDVFTAAGLGNVAELRRQLDADPKLLEKAWPPNTTPLDWALMGGQRATAELLLQRGAAFERPEQKFEHAALSGNAEFVTWLLDTVELKHISPNNLAPALAAATRKGPQPAIVRKLVIHGADPRNDARPMVSAAFHGDIESMKLLLVAGANIDARAMPEKNLPVRTPHEVSPMSPLMRAIAPTGMIPRVGQRTYASYSELSEAHQQRTSKSAIWLLENGASVKLAGPGLVYMAVTRRDPALLRKLLQAGANPDELPPSNFGRSGHSPLAAAVDMCRYDPVKQSALELIDVLLEYGANPSRNGDRGSHGSALELARQAEDSVVLKRLEAAIAKQKSPR